MPHRARDTGCGTVPRTQRSVEHLRNGALQSRGPGDLLPEETGVPVLRSGMIGDVRIAFECRTAPGTRSYTSGKNLMFLLLDIYSCSATFLVISS